jgi:predicted molibdopterin-dependent oxidoreductase YjgC
MQAVDTRAHPVNRIDQKRIIVQVDGISCVADEGQMVSAVLVNNGIRIYRHTEKSGSARGLFCGMGICFECLVTIDGVPNQRACVTSVAPGMKILTQQNDRYDS